MPKNLGKKLGFTAPECIDIQHWLIRECRWRDLAIVLTGVDTHLRSIDLRMLGYDDVIDIRGQLKTTVIWGQKKNNRTVECALSPPTQEALRYWIEVSRKKSGDYLFTRTRQRRDLPPNTPISRKTLARIVKQCAWAIGLDPGRYSSKSLRVTRIPAILDAAEKDYMIVRDVLGHSDIRSTVHYCLQAVDRALEISRSIQFFEPMTLPVSSPLAGNASEKIDQTHKISR